ncbi:MAG: hypothetical protein M3Y28_01765 [Armatimonadota bacterium]|nr:hypothetical protein [Armatimonadota bacterium]
MAKTKEADTLAYALNPKAGAILTAPAGGQAEAEFDFLNDSPDVAAFYLEVEGLPDDWVSGVGPSFQVYVAASSGGQLRLTLTPGLMAALGEYDFKVRILSAGLAVGDDLPLVIRVDPAPEGAVESYVEPSPEPEPEPISPPPAENNGAAAQEAPVTPEPVFIPAPTPEPIPEPVSPIAKATPPVLEPEPEPVIVPTPAPVLLTPAPPPVLETKPAPVIEAKPEPIFAPEPVVKPAPPPVQETKPAPVVETKPEPIFAPEPVAKPAPKPEPVQKTPLQVAPPPVVEPKPTPAPPPPPVTPKPKPVPQTPVQQTPITPKPAPTPARPAPPPPTPSRPAPPPPEEEAVLVDYNPRATSGGTPIAYDDDEEEKEVTEPFLMDPKDGTLIPLRPGERMLLRFPFTNLGSREQTYILDEDRSLEDGWLTLVQDQVNLTRNGTGELSFRLTPPENAEPGDYPLNITLGPQGGQLMSRALTLSMLATPAVELKTKTPSVKVGPAAKFLEFPLSVENAGNADTAFRIAVKAPETDTPTDGAPTGSGDIYETPQWRYLFDKELESLRSPATGREPRPVPITLRVRPKGAWWFGFKQTHKFRVAAIPVTEPTNCGKPGNSLELTAIRSRWLPFPALFLLLLIPISMLFFSGGASDLTVTNAQYTQVNTGGDLNGNAYWVVEPTNSNTKPVHLTWEARPLALLRLTGSPVGQENNATVSRAVSSSGHFDDAQTVSSANRKLDYHYRISRLVGGADRDAVVHYIYTSSSTPLIVTTSNSATPIKGNTLTLAVPSDPTKVVKLIFKNGTNQALRLNRWIAQDLSKESPYKFAYSLGEGSLDTGQSEQIPIKRNPVSENWGQKDQIVFVTTDASRPVLTVNLVPGP